LHDRLGHSLTMLKLALARFVTRATVDAAAIPESAAQLNAEIDSAIDTTRQLSAELRPPMLDDFGLAAALEWAGKKFAARTGLTCQLELDECAVDSHIARALYAISQEALTNVIRHASAHVVTLRLSERDTRLCLEISDDGVGIPDLKIANLAGLGMLGMCERAAAIGATVDIAPVVPHGTSIKVTLDVVLRS
ncbi:MAG: ATP-binding protein, partial [Gemmatimonadaceae bacterium]